jgi:hypothetical protein
MAGSTYAVKFEFLDDDDDNGVVQNYSDQTSNYDNEWNRTIRKIRRRTKFANGTYLGTEAAKTLLRSTLYTQLARQTNGNKIKTHATINAILDLAHIILKVVLGGIIGGTLSGLPNFLDFLGSLKMINNAREIAQKNNKYGAREIDMSLLILLLSEKGTYCTAKIMDLQDEPIWLPGNVALRITSFALWIARRYYEDQYIDRLLQVPTVPDSEDEEDIIDPR